MNTLNKLKNIGKKLKISAFCKKSVPFILSASLLFIPLTFSTVALESTDTNKTTVTINNPRAAFPDAYFSWFPKEGTPGDLGWTALHTFQVDTTSFNSAQFFGEFQSQYDYQNWDRSNGVYKVILRGDPPVRRLYAGDSIRFRCTINLYWHVNPNELLSNIGSSEVWSPDNQFSFMPLLVRSYCSAIDINQNIEIELPIYDSSSGELVSQGIFDDNPLNIYGADIQDIVLSNPSAYPSIGSFNNEGFGRNFPFKATNRPYQTSVYCDFTIPIPSDVTFDTQPLRLVFDATPAYSGTKYEHLNFISFEMHNFSYQITSNTGNLQLTELALINSNLNSLFGVTNIFKPDLGNKDLLPENSSLDGTIPYVEQFDGDIADWYKSINKNGIYESAADSLLTGQPLANSLRVVGSVVGSFIAVEPISKFLSIALPVGIVSTLLGIGFTAFNNSSRKNTKNKPKKVKEARKRM